MGIGTDVVQTERLRQALDRHGARFPARILSTEEQVDFDARGRSAAFLARRFAAKEAASKALGTGIGTHVRLREIVVGHTSAGQPLLSFTGRAADRADALGVTRTHLTISDEQTHAVAFVILERVPHTESASTEERAP